ncbi:tc1-mariner class transposase [Moniliophthora roreri]|nr:tc1-mariner class transposase [Moniliophthora roreri]
MPIDVLFGSIFRSARSSLSLQSASEIPSFCKTITLGNGLVIAIELWWPIVQQISTEQCPSLERLSPTEPCRTVLGTVNPGLGQAGCQGLSPARSIINDNQNPTAADLILHLDGLRLVLMLGQGDV